MVENLEREEWRDIEGYEGKYQISNKGRVKSLNYRNSGKEGLMKPYKNEGGYLKVNLKGKDKYKLLSIHRLVANAFIPNPENKPCINHKSENKTENFVENLEWVTHRENNNWGTRIERIIKANKKSGHYDRLKATCSKPVAQIDLETNEVIKIWFSTREVQREKGFNHQHISLCCNGKLKTSKGYKWQYV